MNTNDMTRDELTNSERAAKAVIEDVFAPGPAPKSLIDEAAAIIRREIPGCDDLDALRRRVAVLEGACKMTVAQWDDVCVPGAACEGCPEPDYVAACRAALSAAPPATRDSMDEQLVDERDAAEEAISQAYYLVVGHSPEWSNNFGHEDALRDIGDAVGLLKHAAKPDPNADKDAAAIRHLQLENDGLRSMLNRVRDVLRDMHDPADLGAKIAAEGADANAEIVRWAVELAQSVDDFCGELIGGANWTDHTGRVANMTRINDASRIAEMILRDAAALRAGERTKE